MRSEIDRADRRVEQREHRGLERPASPAMVITERLCDASEEKSSRRAPGTRRTAAAIAATISARRPSLMFGMHSMIATGHNVRPAFAGFVVVKTANSLTDRDFCPIIAPAYSRHPID